MVLKKLLLRLFVNNHKDSSDPSVRTAIGKLSGGVGIFCNLLLSVGKLAAGVLSGAVSVIADALNTYVCTDHVAIMY